MALEDNYQYRQALDLVKTGLQSGSIKLTGTGNTLHASNNGKADAAYLNALLEDLVKTLPAAA